MKKIGLIKLEIFVLIIVLILGFKSAFAQSTDPATTTTNSIVVDTSDNADAPYTNLPQDEYDKLPLSARLPNDVKEQVSIDIFPEVPHPGDKVTITVSAYGGIDVNSSVIDWVVDGKSVLKGIGKKAFSFYPPGNGKVSNVELHIKPEYGPEVVRTFKFNPSETDILWQANTYTPPFYKGKALYTPQSDVQFVAMPNITRKDGSKIQPQNTVYNWEVDYTPDASKSGYGVNSYDYTGTILAKPTHVRVTGYDPLDQSATGIGTLDLDSINPLVLMYEVHPTYGTLFNNAAIGSFNFNQDSIQLGAYPLFYSATSKKNPSYQWTINGNPVPNISEHQDFLVLQKLKQESGNSTVAVAVSNGDKSLQLADTVLNLKY